MMNIQEEIELVAVDLGYGDVKATNGRKKISFPSAVARYIGSLELTGAAGTNNMFHHSQKYVTEYSGEVYYIGPAALSSKTKLNIQSRDWIASSPYMALFQTAFEALGVSGEINLVTGLPTEYFTEDQAALKKALLGHTFSLSRNRTVKVSRVIIMPQPLGTYSNEILDNYGKIIGRGIGLEVCGVCDCGYYTVDGLVLEKGNMIQKPGYVERPTYSIVGGVSRAIEVLRDEIKKIDREDRTSEEIVEITKNGYMHSEGKKIDLSKYIKEAKYRYGDEIKTEILKSWGHAKKLNKIIFTGGGSEFYRETFGNMYPHGIIVKDTVFSNVMGYFKVGLRVFYGNK